MKKRSRSKKKQGYDDRFTVFLFLAVLVAILFLLDAASESESVITTDQILKKLVISDPAEDGIAFVIKDRVDNEKLLDFANMDYTKIKEELGLDYDFSVYFEDENGNLIPIGGKYCIGSPKAKLAGISCG